MKDINEVLISSVLVGGEGGEQLANWLGEEEAHGSVEDTVDGALEDPVGSNNAPGEESSSTDDLDGEEGEC